MGSESWLSSLLSHSRKSIPKKAAPEDHDRAGFGILAFEVSSLMSKVANLWRFLRDNEISMLREEIENSIGIRNLIAEDVDYAMDLVLNEIIHNFLSIACSVGRLGRKCVDPLFARFEQFVNDPIGNYAEWLGWDYRLKKMERKVKKMEKFAAFTMQLCHEKEVLDELEQTLRRMQANPDLGRGKLLEFQQKVMWQRQEVRYLQEMSPWVRTHDYVVRLLARSLLTILKRIVEVFRVSKMTFTEEKDKKTRVDHAPLSCLPRSHSFSVHPSDNVFCGISSAPKSGRGFKKNKQNQQLLYDNLRLKTNSFAHLVYLDDCKTDGNEPIRTKYGHKLECWRIYSKLALAVSNRRLLDAPFSTLGHAALALRYANVIVLIERLASSPHMIDSETRDELYNMLPTAIRTDLRTRLKALSVGDVTSDVAKWSESCEGILEWLCPLAHSTIRWHSERSFERQQNDVSAANVVLVQTLHYADRAKTEAAIVELLVGLSYLCRTNGDVVKSGCTVPSRCRVGCGSVPERLMEV